MTVSISPSRIWVDAPDRAPSRSARRPRGRRTRRAARSTAGEPSSSTQPSRRLNSPPPPWKMNPNMKMKMSGKASVQNRAARSRDVALDVGDGEGPQGGHRVRLLNPAAPGRSGRGTRPRASPAGCRGSAVRGRARRRAPAAPRWSARRPACRAASRSSSCLDRDHRRQRRELVRASSPSSVSNRTARSWNRLLTSSSTVPISRIRPWSMIASRSHRISASSM